VKLTRVVSAPLQQRLDPFLMLDAFRNEHADDYIGGFPNHPHRGFETVTYMIAGRMRHHDSAGNEGLLTNGSVQWMTAGAGLIHSEMPEQEDGRMEGFQLWLNLPAADKMTAPTYRDIAPEALPVARLAGGVTVKVIAGESHGVAGAVQRPVTEPLFLDIELPVGGEFSQAVPRTHNALVYVYHGEVTVAGTTVTDTKMAILANDAGSVTLRASAPARALIIAGRPLNEPIVQYGPFVMNSQAQIAQAIADYQQGRFGTTRATRG
jgi:redox-sensitive bicupin YhaK (pirin superfamily)